MRFIPIGITSGADLGKILNVSDYSDEKYDAVQLREGNRNNLVLIMHAWNALRARCSLPDKKESNPAVNSGCLSRGFPELADEINFEEVV